MTFDRNLYTVPNGVETRWASPENFKAEKGKGGQAKGGRKGSPCFGLKAGETRVLAEETGVSGTIRRIWITISEGDYFALRAARLDFFWDGAQNPAISVPLGDFFGHGLGRMVKFESALFSSPEGRSFNCYIPMPFKKGMKITVTNRSSKDIDWHFYYDVDYTIGDRHGDDDMYLHAHYNRQNPTKLRKDYEILPSINGKGKFLGAHFGVIADTDEYFGSWWGEGEVKVYLDGDTDFPTLCGTGTEDYIGTGFGQKQYYNLYQGCHYADAEKLEYCFYRYHILDPIYFQRDISVTIQQMGFWSSKNRLLFHQGERMIYSAGEKLEIIDFSPQGPSEYGLFERQDDWSSCAYFYMDKPDNDLPVLDYVFE